MVERAAEGAEPYPFEEASDEERKMRRLAHKLWDEAGRRVAERKEPDGAS